MIFLSSLAPKDARGLLVRAESNHRLSRFQESILDASEFWKSNPRRIYQHTDALIRAQAPYRSKDWLLSLPR